MRVLHVIEGLGLGGAETLLKGLLPRLASEGCEQEVAVLGGALDLRPDLEEAGVPVHALALPSHRHVMLGLAEMGRLLSRRKYDLVHTHLARANLIGRVAAARARIDVTSTYHDTDYENAVVDCGTRRNRLKILLYRTLDQLTARACRRVIVVSNTVGESVGRHLHLPTDRVTVIYNGIPEEAFAPQTAQAREKRRKELALPTDVPVVVQVGRLAPQKGQMHTLRAAQLADRDILWLLVGEGPARPLLEAEIVKLGVAGRVRLVGGQRAVRPFLEAADVFAFPSFHEGLGLAAVEAMAARLPVVAYENGALREVLGPDGGVLVGVREPAALLAALCRLLDQPEEAGMIARRGFERARNLFTLDRCVQAHVRFYRRWLSGSQEGI